MYQILATKMAVPTTSEVTQPVVMTGANAAVVEITVFSGTVSSILLQGSNDLENWIDLGTSIITSGSLSAGAYYLPGTSSAFGSPKATIATQYIRLKLTASSAAIVALGVNTSQL